MRTQKHLGDGCAILGRKWIVHAELHRLGDDLARQGIAVRVQARAGECNEHVAITHALRTQHTVFLDDARDEAGKVVIRWRVQPRHLGGLATQQRASVLTAAMRDACDDTFHDGRIELAECDVIQEVERYGTHHEDVVDAVVDEIPTHGIMHPGLDRHLQLRAHTVGARHEHGRTKARRHTEHAAKAAEAPTRPWSPRRFDMRLDATLRVVGLVEIDACTAVVQRCRHAGSGASNATRRWNSRTRASISGRVSSIVR